MQHRPLIGITPDYRPGSLDSYCRYPWYALKQHYSNAIEAAGGIPFVLPYHSHLTDTYINLMDGILVTGGDFDIDPKLYGATYCHETVKLLPERTTFEWELVKKALQHNKPILGICGGMQLLNVLHGGSLIQHIEAECLEALNHQQPNPRTEPSHDIKIHSGTLLHQLTNTTKTMVNSSHHQAIKNIGKDLKINALAPDGIIEGIENPQHRFCLGVQWHPEFHINETDKAIFTGFITATRS